MPKKKLESLTESMFYVLMVLSCHTFCGTEIAQAVKGRSGGRVTIGPATLYTILSKFLDAGYLCEVPSTVGGRTRTYRLTEIGEAAYKKETQRLLCCLSDAEKSGEDTL